MHLRWVFLAHGPGEVGLGDDVVVNGSLVLTTRSGELGFGIKHVE
jgi:hypothetical protein